MKIKQLIKLLSKQDPERTVLMASDSEGNSYSKMEDFNLCAFKTDPDDGYELGLEKLTPKLAEEGYSEEDVLKGGKPAIVFYP